MSSPRRYFDNFAETDKRVHRLPHWTQENVPCFVTWRLADSIPSGLRDQWRNEREVWLLHHPEPWDIATSREYRLRFTKQFHDWLDQGIGSCVLRAPAIAKIVADALLFFDGDRCDVDCFVVMPNHVHVVFTPRRTHSIPELVKSWKAFTARQINLAVQRAGPLWQEDYWDRLIRNEQHLLTCRDYIRTNPQVAKLRQGEFVYYERKEGRTESRL